jgi:hypothetical protein
VQYAAGEHGLGSQVCSAPVRDGDLVSCRSLSDWICNEVSYGPCDMGHPQGFPLQKIDIFILFATLFSAAHVETWPRWLNVRHAFWIQALIARRLLPVHWQPEQTGNAMRSYARDAELEQGAGAARART